MSLEITPNQVFHIQDKTKLSLTRMEKQTKNTKEIGREILQNLQSQTTQMNDILDETVQIQSKLAHSHRLIRIMKLWCCCCATTPIDTTTSIVGSTTTNNTPQAQQAACLPPEKTNCLTSDFTTIFHEKENVNDLLIHHISINMDELHEMANAIKSELNEQTKKITPIQSKIQDTTQMCEMETKHVKEI